MPRVLSYADNVVGDDSGDVFGLDAGVEEMNNSKGDNVEKEWCREHITERNNWFVTQSGKKIEIQSDWKFCPICGTPRPSEPKKGLAEKLMDRLKANHDSVVTDRINYVSSQYDLARVAKEWFLGVVENLQDYHLAYDFKSELIKKLKEEGEA